MKFIACFALFLSGCLLCFSCTSEEVYDVNSDTKGKPVDGMTGYSRTVLVYMVESDLYKYLPANVDSMVVAATEANLNNGHLVVFYSEGPEKAELYEIKDNRKFPIATYTGKSAISPDTMGEIIAKVKADYPSDSYGMILSSHGSAWLPQGYSGMLRSFGEEDGDVMELEELTAAIPDHSFDFILFDACSMGAVECVYALKDKADYIVSSPSETLVAGFPYQDILPYFFTDEARLDKVAEGFYNYYMYKSISKYGNVSVVDTKELDNLAATVKEILSGKSEADWFAFSPDNENSQLLSHLPGAPIKLYDFDDIISYMATDAQNELFEAALRKAVPIKHTTPNIYCKGDTQQGYSIAIDEKGFSGLSTYAPRQDRTQLNTAYKSLAWYKAVF